MSTTTQTAMASLVGSLADNKAALGRRYAEWAVSAPTLESAVAAAAMAQDELGHSRSTYPVLKALGAEIATSVFGGDRRLALLDDELPDWNAFIAANLLVDGVLTTFVAACVDSSSSRWPSARRRSSRRRARTACTARRGPSACAGATSATRSSRGCRRPGSTPRAGSAPTTTPAYAAALEAGEVKQTRRPPARADARLADSELLAGRGRRDRAARADVATAGTPSAAGGSHDLPVLLLARGRARRRSGAARSSPPSGAADACSSYFEAVRDDFDDGEPATGELPVRAS